MSTSLKPAFDPVLLEVLNQFPRIPEDGVSEHELVLQRRQAIAPQCESSVVLVDPDILHEEVTFPGPGGNIILTILRYKNSAGGSRPAFYYIHGGSMVMGTRHFLLNVTFPIVKEFDAVVISVEYRLAPEHPAPAQVEDCYAGLDWVAKNTIKLGIDPARMIISGSSAGGGLAAGVALLARDRKGPSIFAQLLTYPMLDDRNTSISCKQYESDGLFNTKANRAAWDFMLPGARGSKNVSIYAVPARAEDLSGLPPTFIEVGAAELFRDENVAYASKLWEGGVDTELHVWPGA